MARVWMSSRVSRHCQVDKAGPLLSLDARATALFQQAHVTSPGPQFEVTTRQLGKGEVEHVAKIKLWDKMRALELLVKYLQLIKPEPTGNVAIVAELFPPEVLNAMSDEELAVAKKLLQRKVDALRA